MASHLRKHPRERSASPRPRWRLLPLLAVLVLPVGPTRVTAAPPPEPEPSGQQEAGPADVPDTHRRLEKIYDKLNIQRKPEAKEQPPAQAGCQPARQLLKSTALAPAALGYVLVGLVLATMLVPLLLVLVRTLRQREPLIRGQHQAVSEDAAGAPPARPPLDLEQCRLHWTAGRRAEAYAALHRLTLEELARQQQLSLEQSTTNWGYVRQLARKPALQQLLSAVTLAAERAVLGQTPAPAPHYQELEQLLLRTLKARA